MQAVYAQFSEHTLQSSAGNALRSRFSAVATRNTSF
jgi:hypothetical protein